MFTVFYFNKCKLLHKSIIIIPPDIQDYPKHCRKHLHPHSKFQSTDTIGYLNHQSPKVNSVYIGCRAKSNECQHCALTSHQLFPYVYSSLLNSCNPELPLSHTNSGNEKLTGVHNYWKYSNTDGGTTGQLQYVPTFSVLRLCT